MQSLNKPSSVKKGQCPFFYFCYLPIYSAVRNPEKCREEDSKKLEVNTPVPGECTPLMLAVLSRSSSFTTVDVLLSTRVKLDATNYYGRTALHLAAVCGRGDYVKKLLAAGANPNAKDNWGQSALHAAIGGAIGAAIGAAAEGAFQVS